MLHLLLLYYSALLTACCFGAQLFHFGSEQGDQEMSFTKDMFGVTLDVPVIYFEENQNELFMSFNGIVTFGKAIDTAQITDLDHEKINAIAVFFAPATDGKIFYRATSSDTSLLNDLTDKIRKNFPNRESSDFTALHAVVITWNDILGENVDESSNQFQLVLVTDGISSYAFLLYNRINWTGKGDRYAQAGLYFSDGRHETMVNSGTASIRELVNLSNNQNEGTYIFRISGASPEDPRGTLGEDDYNYNDYEPEYDPDSDDNKRQYRPTSENCPPDPYRDQCPAECQVLTDDRGCSLCVCAQPPEQREAVEEDGNEIGNVVVPSQRERMDIRPEPPAAKGASQEQNVVEEQPAVEDQHHENSAEGMKKAVKEIIPFQSLPELPDSSSEPRETAPTSPENPEAIHDVEDIALSCAAASEKVQPCSTHARCIDYNPGYCCECLSGYYGNGEECLRDGEPQRINGGFEGVINGEEMERTELHTYVMAEEGRSYTALSQIPPHIGRSLLLLNAIGGAMGWLFAKVMAPTSYNGFMLTGGLFNRTVNVHIGDRYAVTIRQQFSGRDIYHYFKAHMFITGTLPKLAEGAEVVYPDHEEEYRREGPGFLRSYSSQMVTVRENGVESQMKLSIDQQIHYKECSFREFMKDSVVVIQVERLHVVYDAEERIVRYASANMATNQRSGSQLPSSGYEHGGSHQHQHRQHEHLEEDGKPTCTNCIQNACESGRHLCTQPHMSCTPVERSYRCECVKGYQAQLDNTVQLGWRCVDVNECERGDHSCDRNAICTNVEGTFECKCRDGYEGDGHRCQRMGGDGEPKKGTSGCREHQDCHQWGECVFGQNGQPGYCKCRGWYVGDGVHHCGPPGETEITQVVIDDSRPEQTGQTCGGYQCDVNADCDTSSGQEQCVCRSGYHGNGISCVVHIGGDRTETRAGVSDKICRSHEECGEHSNCVYSNQLGAYRCVCVPPYTGDGVHCVEQKTGVGNNSSDGFTEQEPCNVVNNCDTNGDCIFEKNDRGESVYRCRCRPGFSGDGYRCAMISLDSLPAYALLGCDQLGNCDPNADCVRDEYTDRHYCQCRDGFDGDGYSCNAVQQNNLPSLLPEPVDAKTCRDASDCHRNAHCVVRENSLDHFCECLPGYQGDGVTRCTMADDCTPADTHACHENAECVFGEIEGAYTCKCVQGFVGDGKLCLAGHAATCNEQPRICHVDAQCIYSRDEQRYKCVCKPGTVGDGYTDCRQEDESHRCGKCSSHARCMHVEADDSWKCRCKPGYVGNGRICAPYTSCLDDRSLCDENAKCIPGEYGHYICDCNNGYHGNGRTCTLDSESREEVLFVCRGMTIIRRSTNPDLPGKQLIVVPHQIAVGIDFDCQEERIVWSDIAGHSILSASMNGTDEQKFMNSVLKSPEGIAVDWSSRNVYYTDSVKDEIGVASLDGKYYKTLISEGLVNPRALAIDLNDRYLYYSDWHRENPVIGRVRLDGTENTAFVTKEIHLPNGLAVLLERRELCWVDAGLQQLSCIGLDGHSRRTVYTPLQYPFGLTVHKGQRFYWTDWSDNKIHSVSINGEDYTSFPATIGGSGRLYGLVSVPLQCKGAATACAVNNGGCEHLCLPGKVDVTCACPDNIDRC